MDFDSYKTFVYDWIFFLCLILNYFPFPLVDWIFYRVIDWVSADFYLLEAIFKLFQDQHSPTVHIKVPLAWVVLPLSLLRGDIMLCLFENMGNSLLFNWFFLFFPCFSQPTFERLLAQSLLICLWIFLLRIWHLLLILISLFEFENIS